MTFKSEQFSLAGRYILVTGAAGLLGTKHAECIAASGGLPILTDINEQALAALALELEQAYQQAIPYFVLDITDEAAVKQTSEDILQRFGRLDGLVNNAANNPKMEDTQGVNFSRLENFPMQVWEQDIAVGLTGAYLCAKHFGQLIANTPGGGAIVNICSDLAVIAPDQRLYHQEGVEEHLQPVKPVTYSVVKHGLLGLSKYLATYWPQKQVRSNALCPGGVENGQPEAFLEQVHQRIPMHRMARADEYQGTLIWMLSDASSYLNGAVINVDGGRTVW